MGTVLDRLTVAWSGDVTSLAIGIMAVIVGGILLAIGVGVRRRAARSLSPGEPAPPDAPRAEEPDSPRHRPRSGLEAEDQQALIAFAQELLAATTTNRLREIVTRHLTPMLGSRRLWISTHIRGRRQVIVPENQQSGTRELLTTSMQEWTTFPLRIDGESIGLIGLESAGGLKPYVKQLVQAAAPLIALALNSADQFEALREASLVDLLTGAATRREGLTRLGAEIKRAQRTGSALAVLMLDLDRFKAINDRFGHSVGDAVLTEVGRTLQRTLRASDSRCRWGGEEFLIVLPETDLARAQVVANGLLRNIASTTVMTPDGPVGCSVSIGLTITRPGETNLESIVRRADIALYRAKEAGRGCVRVVLGDREGSPIGHRPGDEPPSPAALTRAGTLPFPDRRNPLRRDRRSVPSPGRRSTDVPQQRAREEREPQRVSVEDNLVPTTLP